MPLVVDNGTMPPDLSVTAGLDFYHAHSHHGPREHLEEHLWRALGHALDVSPRRVVGDERGIGLEESLVLEQAVVVAEVKGEEAPRVHLHDGGVIRGSGAIGSTEVGRILGVQRWVCVAWPTAAGEVV